MRQTARTPAELDPEVLACLQDVIDPEVGLSIVALGLVYGARRSSDGIDVAITLTTRACPMGDMVLEAAEDALARRFPDAGRIRVDLVWEPLWNPDFITDEGRALLGHPRRT